jgi:hypothetical protein
MVKYTKELEWKQHMVDLEAFEAWAKANCGADYCGNSADAKLRLHFLEQPSQAIEDAIDSKWEDLDDEEHPMCVSYKSEEERKVEAQAKKASAISKLAALGLSQDELKAILG